MSNPLKQDKSQRWPLLLCRTPAATQRYYTSLLLYITLRKQHVWQHKPEMVSAGDGISCIVNEHKQVRYQRGSLDGEAKFSPITSCV